MGHTNSAWKPHVQAAVNEIYDKFHPSSVGTYPGHQPNMSLAADFMCSIAVGERIVPYAVANMSRLGIEYIIHNRQMYRSYVKNGVPIGKPAPYHGTPNPHTDHVHISFKATPGKGGPAVTAGLIDWIPGGQTAQNLGEGIGEIKEIYRNVQKITDWASNRQNWINVLLIVIGALLIFLAIWRVSQDKVMDIVKAVA